jgi:hypothetical protein
METRVAVTILLVSIFLVSVMAIAHPGSRQVEGFRQQSVSDHLSSKCMPHTYPDLEKLSSVTEVTRRKRRFNRTHVYRTFFSEHSTAFFVHTVHGRSRLTACISQKHPLARYFEKGSPLEAKIPPSLRRLLHLAHVDYAGLMNRVFARTGVVGREMHAEVRAKFNHNALYALLQRLLVIEVIDRNAALMDQMLSADSVVGSLRAQIDAEKRNAGVATVTAETLTAEVQTLQHRLECSDMATKVFKARASGDTKTSRDIGLQMKERECSNIPSRKPIDEGLAVKCGATETNVYRYTHGKLRHYPNPDVASAWDPNWGSPEVVDCTGIPRGPPMAAKRPVVSTEAIGEGWAIMCGAPDTKTYRYTGGKLRHYPNPEVANTWDRKWESSTVVDCTRLPRGPPMAAKRPVVSTDAIGEGWAIMCGAPDTKTYRYTNGKLRHYPNPEVANTWDRKWESSTVVDCTRLPRGPPMAAKRPVA